MKNQIMILGISILLIVFALSGCFGNDSNNELNKFIGIWKHVSSIDGITIIFESNGNCKYKIDPAKWEIKDEKLIIDFINVNVTLTFNYRFLDKNQILELENVETGLVYDYKKQ